MNTRDLLFSLAVLSLGFGPSLSAADAPAKPKTGYTVVLEVKVDETGQAEDAKVISSDDTSIDHLLEKTALDKARNIKLAPRLKDGKAVKFTAQAPFVFPVEGDEGPEAPEAPKPKISSAVQPVYPAELAAKGEVGGVILEVMIGTDGKPSNLKVLRSSNPAFEKAATTAVQQWSFIPARLNGDPVASRWRLAICFETNVLTTDWTWRIAPRPSLGNYTVVHRTLPDEPSADPAKPATPPAPAK